MLFLIEPEARSASPFGAFVNRNHFAAWLLMVAAPVVGYSIARMHIHPARRGRWRESIGQIMSSGAICSRRSRRSIMVGVLLLTLSRSALAGLGVRGGRRLAARDGRGMSIERTSLPRDARHGRRAAV